MVATTNIEMYGITPKSFSIVLESFKKFQDIEEVILFGSRAKGNSRNGSDIDIAIKTNNDNTRLELSAYLNQVAAIPYRVDVVEYNQHLSNDIKNHIDRVGKKLYKK